LAILFLFPFFFSLYYVLRNQVDKAFLNVYLPCTFLVPYYYAFRLPHMPVLSVGSAVLVPIGISLLVRPKIRWKFRLMDGLVVLFMVSMGLSELLREASPKDGMLLWLSEFVEIFLAYIVGRQIFEPNLRLEAVKRIIFLFVLQTPFALFEFRFGRNIWLELAHGFFNLGDVGWFVQLRGGTARIATAFGDTILAGMLFMVAMALNYYLVQIYKLDKSRLGPKMSLLQKYRIPFLLLPMFLFMTNSRMPMACGVMCFLFLQIPRFRNMRTGAIIILLVVGIGAGSVYAYFQHYTAVSLEKATDEAQTSAIYRKQLVEYYTPVLDAGGWLGWGILSHPSVPGLNSIDNNYLLVELSQGKLGMYTFILIALNSALTLGIAATKFRSRESLFLLFSLMGALIGVFVSLSTVYLGEQMLQVLFLLVGWAQSLQDTNVALGAKAATSIAEPKFRFRRVIA